MAIFTAEEREKLYNLGASMVEDALQKGDVTPANEQYQTPQQLQVAMQVGLEEDEEINNNDDEFYSGEVGNGDVEHVESVKDLQELKKEDVFSRDKVISFMDAKKCKGYVNTPQDARVVSPEEVQRRLSSTVEGVVTSSLKNMGYKIAPENPDIENIRKNIGNSYDKKLEKIQGAYYYKDTYSVGEETKTYEGYIKPVDSNKYRSQFTDNDPLKNLKTVKDIVTYEVLTNFSDITSVAVSDCQLIINNTCLRLDFSDYDIPFPLDCVTYIENGCLAPLFKWDTLRKSYKGSIGILSFDDKAFFTTYVLDDLGAGRQGGVVTMFKMFPNLEYLYIGKEMTDRESLYTEKSAPIKESVATQKRFNNLLDGFHLDVYKGTDAFMGFSFNSLKNYSTNRGNRGFIRYAIGTIARFGLATTGLGVNLGAHLIGGIVKTFKSAVTPISDDEMH